MAATTETSPAAAAPSRPSRTPDSVPSATPDGHHRPHDDERAGFFRRHRWTAPLAVGAVGAAGVAYTAWQDPNAGGVFPQCPTRELFGVDCPGCGGLRAVHAVTQGDVGRAFSHNALVTLLLPVMVLGWVAWVAHSLGVKLPRLPRVPKPVWMGLALAVIAFAVVRNIGGVAVFEYLHSDI